MGYDQQIKFNSSINPQKSKKGPKLRHEKADISKTTIVLAPLSTHHSVARREGSPPLHYKRSGAKVSAGRQKREILSEFP
jgi:hypothetical protein